MWFKEFIQKLKDRRAIKKENEKNLRFIKAVIALAWDYKITASTTLSFSEYSDWSKKDYLMFSHKTIYTNFETQWYGLKYWEKEYDKLVKKEMIPDDWKIERIIEYLRNKCNGNGDENELNS